VKLHFLGTGTSFGVPVVGCRCQVCTSDDPRDQRTRHGALLESDDGQRRLLIDTPPELRLQLVRAGIASIDAVWFTHGHADHIHGVDDLRVFSTTTRRPLTAYAAAECAHTLRHRFEYIFDAGYRPPEGTTKPEIQLEVFREGREMEAAGFTLLPFTVPHGDLAVHGFRCGRLGYVTDAKRLPPQAFEILAGVRVLVLNALWFGRPHPTHFVVEEAVEVARTIGAEQTFLTHLTHRVGHRQLLDSLPSGIEPAYDGLVVSI
jgi:phosphoribosyl 1,2-cyclic phosphate phosphodiesterase